MFLKLEDVAEERWTVVRCGGANTMSVLPATTPAVEGEGLEGICLRNREQMMSGQAS